MEETADPLEKVQAGNQQNISVEQIVDLSSTEWNHESFFLLRSLQRTGSRNVILIQSYGWMAVTCMAFVKDLADHFSVFFVEFAGLCLRPSDIAEKVLFEFQKYCPLNDLFAVIAHSAGGALACEIGARVGPEVKFALIDCYPPPFKRWKEITMRPFQRLLGLQEPELVSGYEEGVWFVLMKNLFPLEDALKLVNVFSSTSMQKSFDLLNEWKAPFRKIPGLCLFVLSETSKEGAEWPWKIFFDGSFAVQTVSGDHFGMLASVVPVLVKFFSQ